MRVLHVGNIANNGYLNAKLQRRLGAGADALVDETHLFSRPEWEDAAVHYPGDPFGSVLAEAEVGGWRLPSWVLTTTTPGRRPIDKLAYRAMYGRILIGSAGSFWRFYRELDVEYASLRPVLGSDLTRRDLAAGLRSVWMHSILMGPLRPLFRRYDIVQGYAIHPVLTMLADPNRPYVAFEHGTMREIPFENSWRGRLLALAYRRAGHVFITNPDVVVQAEKLGLDNYSFLPHPVDEDKYTPGPRDARAEFVGDGELLIFAPARHDWSIKGNDAMLRAFARLLQQRRDAILLAADWGAEVDRSVKLARELGVEERIRWLDPLPKLRMIELYRAADVVLDQFVIRTFGAIAPEAMACGTPVVMSFDPAVHQWCYDVQPPIVAARSEHEIADVLVQLAADPEARERIGRESRSWIERHHGWRLVAGRQLDTYEALLE